VEVCGRDVTDSDVARRRAAGLAYIPEDRAAVGSAPEASAADNLAMGFHRSAPLASGPFVNPSAFAEWGRALIRRFAIRIANERVAVGTLSGGNLQKIVVARELAHEAPALIAEQPTRGLDVGATEHIHAQLVAERDRGRAVLLVSAELSEILGLSDRVLVMFEGRILAEIPQEAADEQNVGLLMAGRGAEAG
jgi:simple sugar transport system ATP-binding protein